MKNTQFNLKSFNEVIKEYSKYGCYNQMSLGNINDPEEAKKYIDDYFDLGGKKSYLSPEMIKDDLDNNQNIRLSHMISVYSLAVMFVENNNELKDKILSRYEKFNVLADINHSEEIYYYLFLLILYHDLGYTTQPIIKFKYHLFSFKESVKHLLENPECIKLKQQFRKYKRGYPSDSMFYKNDIYEQYSERFPRNIADEVVEHGTYGGKLFFNNFLLMLEEQASTEFRNRFGNGNITDDEIESFKKEEHIVTSQGVYIYGGMIGIFKDIAFIIAHHNIWKKKLLEIQYANFKKIKNHNPLLYLLCIIDTIELYKKKEVIEKEHNEKEASIDNILDLVKIGINGNLVEVDYSAAKNVKSITLYKWIISILEMPSWIDVNVSVESCIITIEMKL